MNVPSKTLISLCLAGLLAGCGQKGPLYLPQNPEPAPAKPAQPAAPATPDANATPAQ